MFRKTIVTLILLLLLLSCLCTGLPIAISVAGSDSDTLQSAAEALLVLLLCLGPVGLMVGSLAWQIRFYRQSRWAGARLAAGLGLTPLNEAANPLQVWYGGEHAGRPFALRVYARRERSYVGGDYITSARFWLRVVMAAPVPPGVTVAPGPGLRTGRVTQPADAFQMDGFAQLPAAAQAATFAFVQKGYPTGLVGTTFRTHKGARSLVLCDRAAPPDWLPLEPVVLPDAAGVLVHDHENSTLSIEQMRALLDDLAVVARTIEQTEPN